MNITIPDKLDSYFYQIQDEIIKEESKKRKIIDIDNLIPIKNNIFLVQEDITLLKSDAIVNAGNSELLGCFLPLHNCIDNAIHSYAGLQVRKVLLEIMKTQEHPELNEKAKITKGYNLPSKYIIHTVGPIVENKITKENESNLFNCYQSCLKLADKYQLKSIAFCSISTGIYGCPIKGASKIALKSIKQFFIENTKSSIQKVIIDVFSKGNYDVYKREIEKNNWWK